MKRLGLAMYVLAALSAVAFALNLIFGPQWIEVLLEADPDGGDGSLEAGLTFAPAVAALVLWGNGLILRRRVRPA